MTPTLVHRYAFPIREAIETLLGDAVGDCEAWRVRVERDEIIVDVVAPTPGIAPSIDDLASLASNETAKSNSKDPEPGLKGGPLARKAAIMCSERGFWTFSDTASADDAAAWLRGLCGVDSRKMLDHDVRAAREFESIDGRYRRWLQGYDD